MNKDIIVHKNLLRTEIQTNQLSFLIISTVLFQSCLIFVGGNNDDYVEVLIDGFLITCTGMTECRSLDNLLLQYSIEHCVKLMSG